MAEEIDIEEEKRKRVGGINEMRPIIRVIPDIEKRKQGQANAIKIEIVSELERIAK